MNAYGWGEPRVCPTPWCGCPHQEPGTDPRCRACRKRPDGVERHGETVTVLRAGDTWRGEWGSCFLTLGLPVEQRAAHTADTEAAERVAKALTCAELAAWLRRAGYFAHESEKRSSLQALAVIAQMDLWWPRRFVSREAA